MWSVVVLLIIFIKAVAVMIIGPVLVVVIAPQLKSGIRTYQVGQAG